jgi:hypothetical protein
VVIIDAEGLRAIPTGERVAEEPIELVGEEIGELMAVAEDAVGLEGATGVAPPALALDAFLTTWDP